MVLKTRLTTILTITVSISASTAVANTTWPGLRGPSYDGAVHDAQLFGGDGAELTIGWKRELGPGYSVVAVDNRRVVAAFQAGAQDVVAAFDIEHGDELWRQPIGAAYTGHSGSHDGPIATPVLYEGRVFGLGPRGDLFAFDAGNGQKIWKRNLVTDLEAEAPYFGFASSPLVAEGTLVVEIGAGEGKAFGGFNPDTGELIWTSGTDRINYQSPIVTVVEGERHVIAVGNKTVTALRPADGDLLWSYDHNGDDRAMGGETIVPVPAGDGRLLLMNNQATSVMLQITKGDSYEVSELWSGGSIKSSYVQPVYHDGHLYGMNSKIFTCVDAATGETVWRSRGAGDGFLSLVGDYLVIMNKPGILRVARATPEGYEEVTSLKVFSDHSWSAPAFANGNLFVRSMGELARIDIGKGTAGAKESGADWVAATAFGQFLAEVEAADDKAATIAAYLREQETFPIIEPSGAVHFIYQGKGTDVGIVGDMIGYRREDPMTRVADTNLFHYSTRLEPNAAVGYGYIVDYEDPIPDPRNEFVSEGLFGEVSWFSMPAWRAPGFVEAAESARQGLLESYEWESKAKEGQKRLASIYLPAGYETNGVRRYPTLYFFDGGNALENGKANNILDNLIGKEMDPVIAVFVVTDPEVHQGELRDPVSYIQMIVNELVPVIDERYRTIPEPWARATAGVRRAGDAAMLGGFLHGDVFGRVGSIWPIVFGPELAQSLPKADEVPLVIYHAWGTYHIRSPHENWDQVLENRALHSMLREAGYRPAGGETPEGVGWPVFGRHAGDMMITLFPID